MIANIFVKGGIVEQKISPDHAEIDTLLCHFLIALKRVCSTHNIFKDRGVYLKIMLTKRLPDLVNYYPRITVEVP